MGNSQLVHALIESRVALAPDSIALELDGHTLTYGELDARANRLAHYLIERGVGPDVVVGVAMERSLELVVTLLAVLKAGGAYLPLDPSYPADRLAFMREDSGAALVVDDQMLARDASAIAAQPQASPQQRIDPDNLAYIIYTSGSTGRPKGVLIPHNRVTRLFSATASWFQFNARDVWTFFHSYAFDFSVWEIWCALATGGRVVVVPDQTRRAPGEFLALLSARGVTVLNQTPSAFRQLVQAAVVNPLPLAVRTVIFGGEALDPAILAPWRERYPRSVLVNMYGITETTVHVTYYVVQPDDRGSPIGVPIPDLETHLLNAQLQPVPIGEVGEIYVGGAGLARGYHNRPSLTAERFVPGPRGERLYKTGDVARRKADGTLEYVGRNDDQVKIRGYRIELGEIEAALRTHPDVRDAIVLAKGSDADRRLVAYVVGNANIRALREHAEARLPRYMVPSAIVALDALPLTPSGKLDPKALPEPDLRALDRAEYAAPRDRIERAIVETWEQLLDVQGVGIHDRFFRLGGNSLMATQLASRLRTSFGVELPLRALFVDPTVAELAIAIGTAAKATRTAIVAAPAEGEHVLSYAQQRQWLLHQLEPESPAYHITSYHHVTGELDVAVLARALTEMVRRHAALRTTFPARDGVPLQRVHAATPWPLTAEDVSDDAAVTRIARREAMRPFDLATGPLWRTRLLRLGDRDHYLLVTMHHIVSDGWSMAVFWRELTALYDAFLAGAPSPLPEPQLQMPDFARWQRSSLDNEALARQLAYWKQRLAGVSDEPVVPAKGPRPDSAAYQSARAVVRLDHALVTRLRELASTHRATLFMTLLAGLRAVLARSSGQRDFCIGTAIANRNDAAVEPLIGFFVNTLVLRVGMTGETTLAQLVDRERDAALEAYAHQDVPFDMIVHELGIRRDPLRSALFQVWCVHHAEPSGPHALGRATTTPFHFGTEPSKFDLAMYSCEDGGDVEVSFVYDTDVLAAATVEHLATSLVRTLELATMRPDTAVRELFADALPVQRREQSSSVWPRFAEQVAKYADRPAIIGRDRTWTYRELEARALAVCAGVAGSRAAALLFGHGPDMVAAMLGSLATATPYVPLDPTAPLARLRAMISDADADIVVCDAQNHALAQTLGRRVLRIDELRGRGEPSAQDAIAYLLYTSGSTGKPKAVAQSQAHLLHHVLTYGRNLHIAPEDRLSLLPTYGFDAAVMDIFGALLHGAALCLYDVANSGVAEVPAWLEATAITVLHATPTVFRHIVAASGSRQFAHVRAVVLGGEEVRREDFYRWRRLCASTSMFVNGLGPTESTLALEAFFTGQDDVDRPSVPVGHPVDDTTVVTLETPVGRQLTPFGTGEITIASDHVALGYWKRPDETASRFVPAAGGGRAYRTGDIGRLLPDGRFEFVGRGDAQVKILGVRIEPAEIESALAEHPAISSAVVAARTAPRGERELVAYIVGQISRDALATHLRERLPAAMIPTRVVFLDALPKTASGKIDRKQLPEPDWAATAATEHVEPRDREETQIVEIWKSVLGVERVGIRDDFFALGGHSLHASQVIARVKASFSVELPLRSLFELRTVERLASEVKRRQGSEIDELRRRLREAEEQLRKVSGAPASAPSDDSIPRALGPARRVVSHQQRRMWFLHQLAPASPAYHNAYGRRIRGPLDVAALREALAAVVRRHEALRTVFATENGEPVPRVVETAQCEIVVSEGDLDRVSHDDITQPFDLVNGPLLRTRLVKLAPTEHVLLVTVHHIISDAASIEMFWRELWACYRAALHGRAADVGAPPLQYADYAAWQRRQLSGDGLESQLAYWRHRLAGAPAEIALPRSGPRPPVQSYRGGSVSIEVDAAVAGPLRDVARAHGATLYMALLAGFRALLSRYTGQADLCIGTPMANRGRRELEDVFGFFVNTLVLRTPVGDTFATLLAHERDTVLDAHAHQDAPFELVVDALGIARSSSHTPLFQVSFQHQPRPPQSHDMEGLHIEPYRRDRDTSMFDLSAFTWENGSAVQLELVYNPDLFERSLMERMVEHYAILLREVTRDPRQPLARIALAERATSATAAGSPDQQTTHGLFESRADSAPNAIALDLDGHTLTYGQVDARANQLAHYLIARGVGPEVVVGVAMERSLELVITLLAILKAGGAYLPLDPSYPADRLAFMREDSGAAFVVDDQMLAREASAIARQSTARPQRHVDPDNLAYIIYTSGSTGRPKGVPIPHRQVVRLFSATAPTFQFDERDVWTFFHSYAFDFSVWEIWYALATGGRVVVVPEQTRRSAGEFLALLSARGVTVLNQTPSAFRQLVTAAVANPLPLSLRKVIFGGEALDLAMLAAWRERYPNVELVNGYGITETTVFVTFHVVRPDDRGSPIGVAMHDLDTHLLDANLQPVPVGVVGEIYVGGAGLARGYHNRPSLSAERFVPDPFGRPGDRLYKSGDLARKRPDGSLEYIGRNDHQVKIRGFRIELGEIQEALRSHPDVRDAIVIARGNDDARKLAAYVAAPAHTSVRALREYLAARLPHYMVPAAWLVLDALPIAQTGKVDRDALPEPEESLHSEYVPPRNDVEERLAKIWTELLGAEQVGVHDDFFHLGGDSLLAVRLSWATKRELGVELPVKDIFATPTIAALAAIATPAQASTQTPTRTDRPLAPAQQRLWFLHQLAPESVAYHVSDAVRIVGQLDLASLRGALADVVRRHEVLRTVFPARDGVPFQEIRAAGPIELPAEDLSALDATARQAALDRISHEQIVQPFALDKGPLLRLRLLKLARDEHALLVTLHHIITDGWSTEIFWREVWAYYDARSRGKSAALPALPLQYADYAAAQHGSLVGDVLDGHLAYWKQRLAGAPTDTALPFDRPRPAVQTYRGQRVTSELDPELVSSLTALGRSAGTTLFMTLLAAFRTLLFRYCGQNDLCIGTPTANRNTADVEGLIGFFVNTLVLRTPVDGRASFTELLARERGTAVEAYTHQEVPFEMIVDALGVERTLSRNPVFQVWFVHDRFGNAPQRTSATSGLTVEHLDRSVETTHFDLELRTRERNGRISINFVYNEDLFDRATIEGLARHFTRLLAAATQAPDRAISQLELLDAAEIHDIVSYPARDVPHTTLSALFAAQAARTPDAPALVLGDATLSYRDLAARAHRIALALRRRGIGRGSIVGVSLERSFDLVASLLGVLEAGAAFVPLDPKLPAKRLEYMIEVSRPAFVIDKPLDEEPAGTLEGAAPTSDDVAYVLFTSGSTGRPKGVVITHDAIVNELFSAQQLRATLDGTDAYLQLASFAFDLSVHEIFWPLCFGCRLVLLREGDHRDPSVILSAIQKHGITTIHPVPTLLGALVAEPDFERTKSLRRVMSGGEAMPVPLLRDFTARRPELPLINSYGPTETAVTVSQWRCRPDATRIAIGKPWLNTQLYVLDNRLAVAPNNVAGELYIAGRQVGHGYLAMPGLTAERFVPDPFSPSPGARMYRTGDRARRWSDGNVEFLGRVDHQVKVRGFRIELGEIEALLREVAGVRAAVVVIHDGNLAAYVVLDRSTTAEMLRDHVATRVPEYMVPSAFVLVDALPLTASGKVDRDNLATRDVAKPTDIARFVAPRSPEEEALAAMWCELLRLPRVGVRDDFFELGGHSLLAIQVLSRVRKVFGVELSIRNFFETPTVGGVAGALAQARTKASPPSPQLVPQPRTAEAPLSYAQQRLWFLQQLEPESRGYHMADTRGLVGRLDVEALRKALEACVHRHDALRTVFGSRDGVPYQRVLAPTRWELPVDDLAHLTGEQRTAARDRLFQEETDRPFDLVTGPLLRTRLVRLGPEEHVLLVTVHHIIADGWSMGVLFHDLLTTYRAAVRREQPRISPPAISYIDFAQWQRAWLTGDVLDQQLSYWKRRLADAPVETALPFSRARAATQASRSATVSIELDADLVRRVRELSKKQGATVFMTLLAAFRALVYRYGGQEDLCIGTPVANRNRTEIEDLIGFFVNTLVLRTPVAGNESFAALLARERTTALEAYAHQDAPFEMIVDAVKVERSLGRNPLFQILFQVMFAQDESHRVQLDGLRVEPVARNQDATRFDLEVFGLVVGDAIHFNFIYNVDLFEHATIAAMAAHFTTLVREVTGTPQRRIDDVPLLDADETSRIVEQWGTGVVHDAPADLLTMFAHQVAATPDAPAVELDGRTLSYRELDDRAGRLAAELRARGIGRDDRVGIYVERSFALVEAVLGVLAAGACYVPLDPSYPRERLALMIEDSRLRLILTDAQDAQDFGAEVFRVDAPRQRERAARIDVAPDQLAYVIYTSGSTGRPKGVAMSHRVLANLIADQMRESAPRLRTLQYSALSFDVSFQEMFATWCSGGTLVLVSDTTRRDPNALLALMARARVERLFLPWVALAQLAETARAPAATATSLREVITAGEQLVVTDAIRAWFAGNGPRLFNQYGPSETHVATAHMLTGDATTWPSLPPIGRPVANTRAYVLDARMRLVPGAVAGELFLAGAAPARGYLDRMNATAERFVPDPFGPGRMYRTGDRCRWNARGELEFLGRADDQVKVRGYRIELGEVETALARHPDVAAAAASVHGDVGANKRLVGYVVARDGALLHPEELQRFVAKALPEHMVPAAILVEDRLPLTASGKLDRRALRPPDWSQRSVDRAPPRNPDEAAVAMVVADVLGLDGVGMRDDFFALGGHSLLATRVVARLQQLFGVEIPLRRFFEGASVERLAAEVARLRGREVAGPIPRAPRTGDVPLSYAQQRLWFLHMLDPEDRAYHLFDARRLRGPLDVEALRCAFEAVVHRHEGLRTHFPAHDGIPFQRIEPPSRWQLPVEDVTDLEATLAAEARVLFDLATGPLLRTRLLRLAPDEHVLVISMHHIIGDGWSMAVLMREIKAVYAGGSLAPLPIQYADFSVWQRNALDVRAQLAYWQARLADAPADIALPFRLVKPETRSDRNVPVVLDLDSELLGTLRQLARENGATLFMVTLAAFRMLLARYSGQDDICIGTPIANRTRSELEGLVGFFINTLVLRTELAHEMTFSQLLSRERTTALEAYDHQDVPFEMIVNALGVQGEADRNPLFQVLFVHTNTPREEMTLPGLAAEPVKLESAPTPFYLEVYFDERGDGARVAFLYDENVFERGMVEQIVAHFGELLQQAATAPHRKLADFTLTAPATLAPSLPYAAAYMHEHFEAQADRTPSAIAIRWRGGELTYAELEQRANQLAHQLRALGADTGTIVGICVDRSPEMIVAVLATLKTGAAYLPLDPDLPRARIDWMLEDSRAAILVTKRTIIADAAVPAILDLETWRGEATERISVRGDLAYVMYTSGSTGTPKAVAVEHRSLVAYVDAAINYYALTDADRVLQFASFSWDTSCEEIYPTLARGACLVLRDPQMLDSATMFFTACRREGVTVLNLPTAYWHELVSGLTRDVLADLATIRLLVIGGEAANPRKVELWWTAVGDRVRLLNTFGMTETTAISTVCDLVPLLRRGMMGSVPLGKAIDGVELHVLDEHLAPLPRGIPGELYVGGRGVARGYLHRPALTAERFVSHPHGRLYRTGDVVRLHLDNTLEYVGRRDHQVKIRGQRIELGEVEAALLALRGVADVAVVAPELRPGDRQLVAYVVANRDFDPAQLRAQLGGRLPAPMIPALFVRLDSLPRTTSGKVDRGALPAPTQPAIGPDSPSAAPVDVEGRLAMIFGELLGLANVKPDADFFHLGGHSLLAVRLADAIRRAFSVQVPLRELFVRRTVAAIAQAIEAAAHRDQGRDTAPVPTHAARVRAFPSQRTAWRFSRMEPDGEFLHITMSLRFERTIQPELLERVLHELVRRHSILRTTYEEADGGLYMHVSPAQPPLLPTVRVLDLSRSKRPDTDREFAEATAAVRRTSFDLERGPLMRAAIVRMPSGGDVVVIVIHHIAFDAGSSAPFVDELLDLYGAWETDPTRQVDAVLGPAPLQYVDFAAHMERIRESPQGHRQLEYWQQQLHGAQPPRLPQDARPPTVDEPRDPWTRDAEVTKALVRAEVATLVRAFAREQGASIYMTLMAAFAAYMRMTTDQSDLCLHSTYAQRHRRELERVVGLLGNPLIFRFDTSGNPPFRELVTRARDVVLEGYQNGEVAIIDQVPPELVRINFNYVGAGARSATTLAKSNGVRWYTPSDESMRRFTMYFDLILWLSEAADGGIGLELAFNRERLRAQTAERFLQRYADTIERLVRFPDVPLSVFLARTE